MLEAQEITSKQACSYVSCKKLHQNTCLLVFSLFSSAYFYPPMVKVYCNRCSLCSMTSPHMTQLGSYSFVYMQDLKNAFRCGHGEYMSILFM